MNKYESDKYELIDFGSMHNNPTIAYDGELMHLPEVVKRLNELDAKCQSYVSEGELPSIKDELSGLELLNHPSVDVLLRMTAPGPLFSGRYLHGVNRWEIDGLKNRFDNSLKPIEWWPLPTGVQVER
jgi:hypothetical protein